MGQTMAGAYVFVADVERPALAAEDRHHLERVLRLRPGDAVTVSDGAGRWRPCRYGPGPRPELAPDGDVVVAPAPAPPIAVAFALTKGQKPELAVQKLTELGADRIIPFAAARSVVRWTDPARHVERLRRVAHEAACQSRRAWLPVVEDPTTFGALARRAGATLADRAGGPPTLAPLVLVGPEGGWAPEELASGLPRMGLGPHVLRAETASITVGALLAALRAGLVAPG